MTKTKPGIMNCIVPSRKPLLVAPFSREGDKEHAPPMSTGGMQENEDIDNDKEASAATLNLCISFLACLNSRPNLDAFTRKTLIDIKAKIEMVLSAPALASIRKERKHHRKVRQGARTQSLPGVAYYGSGPPRIISSILSRGLSGGFKRQSVAASSARTTDVEEDKHEDEDQGSSQKSPEQIRIAPLSPVSTRDGAGAEAEKRRIPKTRGKKKRALAAVCPYVELSDLQSQQSVLQRLTGEGLSLIMWRHRSIVFMLMWVVGGITFSAITIMFINVPEWSTFIALAMSEEMFCTVSALISSLGLVCYLICSSWIMNYRIATQVFRQLEVFLYVLEASFACISLCGLLCFRPYGFILCINYLIFFSCFICYDSLPIAFRAGRRKQNILLFLLWMLQVGLIYTKMTKSMCYYRVSLIDGIYLEDNIPTIQVTGADETSVNTSCSGPSQLRPSSASSFSDTTTAPRSGFSSITNADLSFSLFDFFLNRAFTLLVYMAKIIYYSFQRPEDCVIIRSRVRLVEIPLHEPSITSTSTSSQSRTAQPKHVVNHSNSVGVYPISPTPTLLQRLDLPSTSASVSPNECSSPPENHTQSVTV